MNTFARSNVRSRLKARRRALFATVACVLVILALTLSERLRDLRLVSFAEAAQKTRGPSKAKSHTSSKLTPTKKREIAELGAKVMELFQQEKYADAIPLAERQLAIRETAMPPDHLDIAESLNNLANLYRVENRQMEAETLHQRALAIFEKTLPEGHLTIATSLYNLAELYRDQSRFAEAEPLYQRALAIREHALPADHPDIATILNHLALLYHDQGRLAAAEPLYQRALSIREEALPPNHTDIAESFNNLASLYEDQGRFEDAETFYQRAMGIWKKLLPTDHPDIAKGLNNLAHLYEEQGRLAEAESLYRRALAINEKSQPVGHPDIATSLTNLALLHQGQGRLAEAEPLLQRALAIREKALPAHHLDIAVSLDNLAAVYHAQGRLTEAEPLFRRALDIYQKVLPAGNLTSAITLNNLAELYRNQKRFAEAEPLYLQALAIREKELPDTHLKIASSLNNLAALYVFQGRSVQAEPLYKRALAIREKLLPADHRSIAESLNNLAHLYFGEGRLEEAEPLLQRALISFEKALPQDHPDIAINLGNLSGVAEKQGHLQSALAYVRRATKIFIKREPNALAGVGSDEIARNRGYFARHIQMAALVADQEPSQMASLRDEAFRTAQYMLQTTAASAIGQASARVATRDPKLANLVREQQDLQYQWQAADKRLVAALSLPIERRNNIDESARTDIARIDARATEIAAEVKDRFPDYAALASPDALSLTDAAKLLRPDEALVFFAPTGPETFVFAVGSDGVAWKSIPLDAKVLSEKVAAVDRGVGKDTPSAARAMADEDKTAPEAQASKAEFDLVAAHELYDILFGPIADVIKDKKYLIIVPDGPLTGFPFQLLVSEAPKADTTFKTAHWLIRDHAISVLPAVSSLHALRGIPRRTQTASLPFAGFGDPVIGNAPALASCANFEADETKPIEVAAMDGTRAPKPNEQIYSGGGFAGEGIAIADVEWVRRQRRLPETRCELEQLAKLQGAGSAIYVGEQATEAKVKELSKVGELKKYRMLAFATHGLLPSETAIPEERPLRQLLAEPGAQENVQPNGGQKLPREIEIVEILPDTTAERAQLRAGDRILSYDGKSGLDISKLASLAADLNGPATRVLSVRRGTENLTFEVPAGRLGIRIKSAEGPSTFPTADSPTQLASIVTPKPAPRHYAEAGLILTPPAKGDDKDDGLLTASEVATLDLDADWVILSACNTAAGDKPGASSLSGLARAFFYAGARSLLVSHWPVDSRAAVLLTTRTLRAMEQDPTIGKAEALRQAMLSFLADDVPESWSNPRVWAPFSLVGEGGR